MSYQGTTQLHLGGGRVCLPGFISIDIANHSHVHPTYRRDIRDLSIFESGSVDLIYCSHALEYFDREEARITLVEWHRVLKPGGILRLAVPDFEAIIKVYRKSGNLEAQGVLGPLYGKMCIDTPEGEKVIYHKTVYDFDSLAALLSSVGFTNIHRYDWRQTIHKDYDDFSRSYIPHKDEENGILISLNVEAEKI